jgi:hypothetical protein
MPTAADFKSNLKTRYMTVKFTLSQGVFPNSNGNQELFVPLNSTFDNLYGEINISNEIGLNNNQAIITIYGLQIDTINTLSRINLNSNFDLWSDNQVDIYAGYTLDSVAGLPPLVYTGQIRSAGADFSNPDRPFIVKSLQGSVSRNIISPPTNVSGTIGLDNLLRSLAGRSGSSYVSNGVTGSVKNVTYEGSLIQQMEKICRDYNLVQNWDFTRNILFVSPSGTPLSSQVYELNSNTGMIGSPQPLEDGVSVAAYFNPSLTLGQTINLTSQYYEYVNRPWIINAMHHILQNRGEEWLTIMTLNNFYTTV